MAELVKAGLLEEPVVYREEQVWRARLWDPSDPATGREVAGETVTLIARSSTSWRFATVGADGLVRLTMPREQFERLFAWADPQMTGTELDVPADTPLDQLPKVRSVDRFLVARVADGRRACLGFDPVSGYLLDVRARDLLLADEATGEMSVVSRYARARTALGRTWVPVHGSGAVATPIAARAAEGPTKARGPQAQ